MLRKLLPKNLIFASFGFPIPINKLRTIEFSHQRYSFSTDQPSKNNSQAVNRLKEKQSNKNKQPISSNDNEQSKDEKGELKKKERVFNKKSPKDNNRQISYIIRLFRESLQGEKFSIQKFTICLKEISSQYRQERHQQFLNHRQQLERLLQNLDLVDFKKTKLPDLLNMLDFIRIVARIQTFSRRTLDKYRSEVLEAVGRYMNPLEQISTEDLLVIFCKICAMPYHKLSEVTIQLHDRMVDLANSEQGLKLTAFQLYILMKSLSKKQFLSHADKRIMQIVLVILGDRLSDIDANLKIQIVKALLDMRLSANISDHRVLSIADRIFDRALKLIKRGNTLLQLEYLSQAPVNENAQHKEMIRIIFHRLVQQIETGSNKFNPLRVICNCLKHMVGEKITEQERKVVFGYIDKLYQEAPIERKELQNILIQLLQFGFFGNNVTELNALLAQPYFDFYWTFAYEYSNQGLPVPIDLLTKKIHSTTSVFKQDSNFLKMACAVAVQVKLHPESQKLLALHGQIIKSISQEKWEETGVEWITKLGNYHPKLVRNFYRQFGDLFSLRVRPTDQMLKQEYSKLKSERLKHLQYWQFVFAVEQFDSSVSQEMLLKLPLAAITLPVSRQLHRKNSPFDHKTLLLSAVLSALQTSKLTLKDSIISEIIWLLIEFQKGLGQGLDSFDELYWSLCSKFTKSYNMINRILKPEVNFLIMLLLGIQRPKVKHSIHYRHFLNDLLTNEGMLTFHNEYTHLKTAILRSALAHNMFSQQHLPLINKDLFSSQQESLIKAIQGDFKFQKVSQQSLILLLRSKTPSNEFFKEFTPAILEYVQESSLPSLEKYLIFYSHGENTHITKILTAIVKEYTKKLQVAHSNILGVISNLKNQLKSLENKVFLNLFNTICKQLIQNMTTITLLDHLQFLKELNSSQIPHEEYRTNLLHYAFQHKYRGCAVIEIAWQLCKHETILTKEQFSILTNYSIFNPDSYLKLLVLHEDILANSAQLLERLADNQTKLVSDNLVLKYISQKYEPFLKKTKSSEVILHRASQEALKLLNSLESNGVQVKGQQFSDQKLYALNSKAIVGFLEINNKNQLKMIEKMLAFLYPQRQIIICKRFPESSELSRLLSQIQESLRLDESVVLKIKEELMLL